MYIYTYMYMYTSIIKTKTTKVNSQRPEATDNDYETPCIQQSWTKTATQTYTKGKKLTKQGTDKNGRKCPIFDKSLVTIQGNKM